MAVWHVVTSQRNCDPVWSEESESSFDPENACLFEQFANEAMTQEIMLVDE